MRPFTPTESRQIAEAMHLLLLDGLSRSPLVGGSLVFQGGTALHLCWGSPRYSEDLDYLVEENAAEKLTTALARSIPAVQQGLALLAPGGNVTLTSGGAGGKKAPLVTFKVAYEHPERRGKIFVKAEFLRSSEGLHGYETAVRQAAPGAGAPSMLAIRPMVLAATARMAYIDKLFALAFRPFDKPRDFHDLWWLRTAAGVPALSGWSEEARRLIRTDGLIYGRSREEFLDGLRDRLEGLPAFKPEDFSAWLPGLQPAMAAKLAGEIRSFAASELADCLQEVATMKDPEDDDVPPCG